MCLISRVGNDLSQGLRQRITTSNGMDLCVFIIRQPLSQRFIPSIL